MSGAFMWAGLGLGFLLGFFIHRARLCINDAFEHHFFRMRYGRMRLLVLLTALCAIALNLSAWVKGISPEALLYPLGLFTIAGGTFLGVGMALSNSGLISMFWKAASGNLRSAFAVIGAVMGVVVYSILFPSLRPGLYDFYFNKVSLTDFYVNAIFFSLVLAGLAAYFLSRDS